MLAYLPALLCVSLATMHLVKLCSQGPYMVVGTYTSVAA